MLSPTSIPLPLILWTWHTPCSKRSPRIGIKVQKIPPFTGPLVDPLDNFLAASHRALDLSDLPIIERGARWCSGLWFTQLGDSSFGGLWNKERWAGYLFGDLINKRSG